MTWPVHFRWVSVKLLVMDRSGSPTYNVDNNHSKSECELTWGWENWPPAKFSTPRVFISSAICSPCSAPSVSKKPGSQKHCIKPCIFDLKIQKTPNSLGRGQPYSDLTPVGTEKTHSTIHPLVASFHSTPCSFRHSTLVEIQQWAIPSYFQMLPSGHKNLYPIALLRTTQYNQLLAW